MIILGQCVQKKVREFKLFEKRRSLGNLYEKRKGRGIVWGERRERYRLNVFPRVEITVEEH